MIKINLATKPGLQDETVNQAVPGSPNEIFTVIPPATATAPKPIGEQISGEIQAEQPFEMPLIDDDKFASIEANLEMLEQAEAEEFVPKHVSLPPEKIEEAEKEKKIEQLTKRPQRRRLVKGLSYLLVLVIIVIGGLLAYNKFLKTPTPSVVLPTEEKEATPTIEQAETTPEQREITPAEEIQPVYPPQSNLASSTSQPIQPVMIQPESSQINQAYIPRVSSGAARCQLLTQIVTALPVNNRLQYLKLTNEKVSFLIYVGNEQEAQRMKVDIQNFPGVTSTIVFYIERVAGTPAPAVQIMAILNLHSVETPLRGIRFQDDVALSQILWSFGKRSGVAMQPLSITEPPAAKPRLAEIRGRGTMAGLVSLLNELSGMDLNLSIEQISLNPGIDTASGTSVIDFSINSVIYPPKN